MKIASAALAAFLVGVGWVSAAQAQGVPQGSYLQSCSEIRMRGDTLVAYCRRPDGYANWTWINQVHRCRGDIVNAGGWLTCTFGGPQAGPPPHGGPPGPGDRRRERCEQLHRESAQLRNQIAREFNPIERARLEGRLQEVHEQESRCRF